MSLVNAYATVPQLREHMSDERDNAPVDMLERALNTASRQIDEVCGRRFWLDQTVQTLTFSTDGDSEIVWVDDIGSASGLIVKTDGLGDGTYNTTWTIGTDFRLEPRNADRHGPAYAWWRIAAVGTKRFPTLDRIDPVQVTARFGWSAIPPEIEEATLLRAYALFKRRSSPTGIQGFEGFGMRTSRFDPDVIALISPFMKMTIGAV